jgi:hypothetical protein
MPDDFMSQLRDLRKRAYDIEDQIRAAVGNDLDGEGERFTNILPFAIKLREELDTEIEDAA